MFTSSPASGPATAQPTTRRAPFLEGLYQAVQVLGHGLDIFPASGAATEETSPDVDALDDQLVYAEDKTAAIHEDGPFALYHELEPVPRTTQNLFQFYVDGSIRTQTLGTAIGRGGGTYASFPMLFAQIGAAALRRLDDGSVRTFVQRHDQLLLVPHEGGLGLPDTVWSDLQAVPQQAGFRIADYHVPTLLSEHRPDLLNKAGAVARFEMHKSEIALIEACPRADDCWLVLDGAVKLTEFVAAEYVLGVAKSFRHDLTFQLEPATDRRRARQADVGSLLASLPERSRTTAFGSYGGRVCFWYLRLRRPAEYGPGGIVKVELPRPDRSPAPTALIDRLSAALLAERTVTAYGADRRWANLLYPIHLAELAIQSRFMGRELIAHGVRWPRAA